MLNKTIIDIATQCEKECTELKLPLHIFKVYKKGHYDAIGVNNSSIHFDNNLYVSNVKISNRIKIYSTNLCSEYKDLKLNNKYISIFTEFICYHEIYHSYQVINNLYLGKSFEDCSFIMERNADIFAYKKLIKKYNKDTKNGMAIIIIFLNMLYNFSHWLPFDFDIKSEIEIEKLLKAI